jgi:hypothetical protein
MSGIGDEEVSVLKRQIRERLAHVCDELPAKVFDELVESIARITYKYEHTALGFMYDRRVTERLLSELRGIGESRAEPQL